MTSIRGRWTIARDRFPRKPNGDRLVNSTQRAVNDWYAAHSDAWDLVEVVPIPDEQAIERAAEAMWEANHRVVPLARYRSLFVLGLAAALEQPE